MDSRTRLMPWAIATLLVAGCAMAQTTHVVEVRDNFFSPASVTICTGDTVEWSWTDFNPHSTTSGDNCGQANGVWDSGVLGNGASFSFEFAAIPAACATDDAPGDNSCSYFCSVHCSAMLGSITVSTPPSGVLAISRSRLRISKDSTEGRGGTVRAVEALTDATLDDIVPGSVEVTLTLTGTDAGGNPVVAVDAATLETRRGTHSVRLDRDPSESLNIRSAKLSGTKDPELGKLVVGYETHGIDLAGILPGTLQVTVTVEQTVPDACTGGSFGLAASATADVN